MVTLKTKVTHSVFWLGGSNAFSQAITWVFTILIARILSPDDYGLMAMSSIYIGFADALNEFGIGAAVIQKKDITEEEIRSTYLISIGMGISLTLISVLIAPLLAAFFHEPRLTLILYALSATFIISAAKNIQQSVMNRHMRFKDIARIEVICKVVTSIVSYICALHGAGVWTLVIAFLLFNAAQAIIYAFCERQRPGKISDITAIKEIFRFGLQVMLARIITILSQRTDMLIISKMINAQVLGVYSLSMSLANKPLDKILSILNQVLFPVFSQAQHDTQRIRQYFTKTFELELLIMLPIYVFIMLAAEPLVIVILGEKWAGIMLPLKMFGAAGMFMFFASYCSMVVTSLGRPRMHLFFSLSLYACMVSSMLVFVDFYGFFGILLSWVTVYPVVTTIYLIIVTRMVELPFKTFIRCFRTPALASGTMGFFIAGTLLLPLYPWLLLSCMMCIGAISYITALLIFDRAMALQIFEMLRTKKLSGAPAL